MIGRWVGTSPVCSVSMEQPRDTDRPNPRAIFLFFLGCWVVGSILLCALQYRLRPEETWWEPAVLTIPVWFVLAVAMTSGRRAPNSDPPVD